jgi:hypothetical protein
MILRDVENVDKKLKLEYIALKWVISIREFRHESGRIVAVN